MAARKLSANLLRNFFCGGRQIKAPSQEKSGLPPSYSPRLVFGMFWEKLSNVLV
jgi:hypothetical protein